MCKLHKGLLVAILTATTVHATRAVLPPLAGRTCRPPAKSKSRRDTRCRFGSDATSCREPRRCPQEAPLPRRPTYRRCRQPRLLPETRPRVLERRRLLPHPSKCRPASLARTSQSRRVCRARLGFSSSRERFQSLPRACERPLPACSPREGHRQCGTTAEHSSLFLLWCNSPLRLLCQKVAKLHTMRSVKSKMLLAQL